jgi:hypothetical protein
MDPTPLDFVTLPDYLRYQADQLKKQRNGGRGRKAQARRAAGQPRFLPLADRLFFRVVPPAAPGQPPGADGAASIQAVEDTFRTAFLAVWDAVTEPDKRTLLAYWRAQEELAPHPYPPPGPHLRPSLRVKDIDPPDDTYAIVSRLGHELTFPLAVVAERPDRLPLTIARALAQVHLHATRRHWGLALEIVEEPLARWERRMGQKTTDASRDAKIDRLEAAHRRAYEKEIAAILTRWGFGPDTTATRR